MLQIFTLLQDTTPFQHLDCCSDDATQLRSSICKKCSLLHYIAD